MERLSTLTHETIRADVLDRARSVGWPNLPNAGGLNISNNETSWRAQLQIATRWQLDRVAEALIPFEEKHARDLTRDQEFTRQDAVREDLRRSAVAADRRRLGLE